MLTSKAKAEEAAQALGLSLDDLTSQTLGAAYKEQAKLHHPDSETGSHEGFQRVIQAKGVLLAWLEQRRVSGGSAAALTDCPDCQGKGYVRVTRGFQTLSMRCRRCELNQEQG